MTRTRVLLVPSHPVRLVADPVVSILNNMAVEIVELVADRGVLYTLSPFEPKARPVLCPLRGKKSEKKRSGNRSKFRRVKN